MAMLAASPSVPNLEKYVLLPKYWQLPEFYGFHSDILSYLPPHEHAEVMVNVVASIFWNLLGEWNKARLSDSVEPHHRVFHQIVNRGELFLLSKCAIFALILQGRMLQRKTAPIKDLRNYTRLTEDIFSSRRIGHLELPGCEDPEAWEIVSKYPHAKRLNLSRASNVRSHAFLWNVANCCRNLQELDLSFCELQEGDTGIRTVAARCQQLRVLTLNNLGQLSEEGLRTVIRCSSRLERLDLRVCSAFRQGLDYVSFTSAIVREIAGHCPAMRELLLPFECSGLNDQDVTQLVTHCRNLRVLHLEAQLTNVAMHAIATYCEHLEELNIGRSLAVPIGRRSDDDGVGEVVAHCTKLTRLKANTWKWRDVNKMRTNHSTKTSHVSPLV